MQAKLTDDLNAFTKKLLNSDLVVYDFKESSNVLFNIEGGKKISMQELTIISEKIHDLAENAKIIFGLTQKPKLKDEIIATVLATGGIKPKEKKKPKENIEDLNVDVNRRSGIEIKKIKEEKLKKEMEEEDYFEIPTFIRNRKKNEKS
jgi:cell division GTPase FtsZ